jgi:hypothetical protein
MSLLNWFFCKITPGGKNTWLSVKYAQWRYSRLNKRNESYKKNPYEKVTFFNVPGAGEIAISDNPTHLTGGAAGFGFSVSWSDSGLGCGGVLGITEAKRLANFILEKVATEKRTEDEIQADWKKRNDEYFAMLKIKD